MLPPLPSVWVVSEVWLELLSLEELLLDVFVELLFAAGGWLTGWAKPLLTFDAWLFEPAGLLNELFCGAVLSSAVVVGENSEPVCGSAL